MVHSCDWRDELERAPHRVGAVQRHPVVPHGNKLQGLDVQPTAALRELHQPFQWVWREVQKHQLILLMAYSWQGSFNQSNIQNAQSTVEVEVIWII